MQANTFARINFLKFLQANILFYKTNFKNCYFNSILLRKKSFSCLMTANSAVVLGPKGFKNGKRISLNTEHLFYVMLILQARHQSISFFNPLSLPSLSPWMTHTRPAEMIYTTVKNSMEITVAKEKIVLNNSAPAPPLTQHLSWVVFSRWLSGQPGEGWVHRCLDTDIVPVFL